MTAVASFRISVLALALAAPSPVLAKGGGANEKKMVKAQPIAATPQWQKAMVDAVNATGPMIDRCNERYLALHQGSRGSATLFLNVGSNGQVKKVKLTTDLRAYDNLSVCLRDIARRWRFPPVEGNTVTSQVRVPVQAGAKFKLLRPGEKPPPREAPPAQKKKDKGFIRFTPGLPADGQGDR